MKVDIRSYLSSDYEKVKALYLDSSLYGGQFDEARDAKEVLEKKIQQDPHAILVAEINGIMVGSISYIEDGRVAMLFRFVVQKQSMEEEVTEALFNKARTYLKEKGHTQILVYTPTHDERLQERYRLLGLRRGEDYTCYWQDI